LSNPGHEFVLAEAKVAAHSLGVRLQALEARGPDNFASAFAAMTRERASALLVVADGMFLLHRTRIADLINLKTAKALRLTIPSSVLLRADEVIR